MAPPRRHHRHPGDHVIRVLVVDDQAMVRRGLSLLLGAEPDMAVAAEAADGGEALRLAAEVRPDVVLMDIRMPGIDGLEATRLLVAGGTGPAVVVLTTFGDDGYVDEALRVGAAGFVLKDSDPDRLVDAVRAAAVGEVLLDPAITRSAIGRWTGGGPAPDPAFLAEVDRLTEREREVLVRLGDGQTNDEIAEAFGVERSTVKSHVAAVLRKLGLRDRVDAAVRAHRAGLVGPPPRGGDEVPPRD